jgi:hypothetical protein
MKLVPLPPGYTVLDISTPRAPFGKLGQRSLLDDLADELNDNATKNGTFIPFVDDLADTTKNDTLIPFKGTNTLEAGYVWAPYIPIMVTPTIGNVRKLKAKWTVEQAEDLRVIPEAESELVAGIADEIAKDVDREIVDDLLGLNETPEQKSVREMVEKRLRKRAKKAAKRVANIAKTMFISKELPEAEILKKYFDRRPNSEFYGKISITGDPEEKKINVNVEVPITLGFIQVELKLAPPPRLDTFGKLGYRLLE